MENVRKDYIIIRTSFSPNGGDTTEHHSVHKVFESRKKAEAECAKRNDPSNVWASQFKIEEHEVE